MIIQRKSGFDAEFHAALRDAVVATHEILKRAELDTPEIREYLDRTKIELSNRMIGSLGI